MPEGGFLEQKPRSPGSLAIVVALHGAAITALMLAKTEVIENPFKGPFKVKQIPVTPPPPPEPWRELREKVPEKQKSEIKYVQPEITHRPQDPPVFGRQADVDIKFDTRPAGDIEVKPEPVPLPPPPVPDPVRREAKIDPRSRLQPPYPPSEQRAENEGSVTVRVLIGTDGRVKDVEKVRATSEAFFRATAEQALKHWRFKPATVDGKPVESRTVMTVHFQLMA